MIGRLSIALVAVLLSQHQPAKAAAEEAPAVELCNLILKRTTAYLRDGDMKRARVNEPYLEKCHPILKSAQASTLQSMQNAVDEYGAKLRAAPPTERR